MSYEAWGESDDRPWPRDTLPACMGGHWCEVRSSCARYHQDARRSHPSERLCPPGSHQLWKPILVEQHHVLEYHALALVHGTARELPAE